MSTPESPRVTERSENLSATPQRGGPEPPGEGGPQGPARGGWAGVLAPGPTRAATRHVTPQCDVECAAPRRHTTPHHKKGAAPRSRRDPSGDGGEYLDDAPRCDELTRRGAVVLSKGGIAPEVVQRPLGGVGVSLAAQQGQVTYLCGEHPAQAHAVA